MKKYAVFLSFDIDYTIDESAVPLLLDILKKHDVRASFAVRCAVANRKESGEPEGARTSRPAGPVSPFAQRRRSANPTFRCGSAVLYLSSASFPSEFTLRSQ